MIHVPIITLHIMRAYKRKTGDGLTSLDETNTAVKEVLQQGKKCRTVTKAHVISEATLRRYCDTADYCWPIHTLPYLYILWHYILVYEHILCS